MKAPIAPLRDAVRSTLWPLPVLSVVVALAAGLVLPGLDRRVDDSLAGWLTRATFGGDAGAARTVLDAVSGSLITVTSLTFSLTVVTLQLASSQFSPRLLRTFARDVFVQATLGVFLATFTYSLTVLRSVRGSDTVSVEFVPRLSVSLSFVLAVASVIMLVIFLAHLVQQIRVETMLSDVHSDASATVRATLGRPQQPSGRPPHVAPQVPPGATTVLATTSGFLVRIDERKLLRTCVDLDVVCVLDKHVGSWLVEGCPMGSAWSDTGAMDVEQRQRLQDGIGRSVHTGVERTAVQDIGFGLRQLTDVANKALSPGINDPTTAVHALGHISTLLCEITAYDLGPLLLSDDDHPVRAVVHRPSLADLMEVSLTQPRRYGAGDPQVMQRLFQLLEEMAWRCRPEQRPVVDAHLDRLTATVGSQDFDAQERAQLALAATAARRALSPA